MDKPVEKCAVALGYKLDNAAETVRRMLYELQHRGQDATGIAALGEDDTIDHFGGIGLVEKAYDVETIAAHAGRAAIGHNRWATSGGPGHEIPTNGKLSAIAHNGHFWNWQKLQAELDRLDIDNTGHNDTTSFGLYVDWRMQQGDTLKDAMIGGYELIADAGTFCITAIANSGEMAVLRDKRAVRPLSSGRMGKGWVVASEDSALRAIGATDIREVEPGGLDYFNGVDDEPEHIKLDEPERREDAAEYIYLARKDTTLNGRPVWKTRVDFGRQMAEEYPIKDADMLIPVPRTSEEANRGYAEVTGLKIVPVIKATSDERSFIQGTSAQQIQVSEKKLIMNPDLSQEVLDSLVGADVVVGDDSMFRGNAQRSRVIPLLRKAGVRRIRLVIFSPPAKWPNGTGVATSTYEELVAYGRDEAEIARDVGADEVYYLSVNGLVKCIGLPREQISMPDFTGENVFEQLHNRALEPATA